MQLNNATKPEDMTTTPQDWQDINAMSDAEIKQELNILCLLRASLEFRLAA